MTVKNVTNLAVSVQARLQNHARATKRPFQELLQYYAMERFLYRLSTTQHRPTSCRSSPSVDRACLRGRRALRPELATGRSVERRTMNRSRQQLPQQLEAP